MLHLLARLVLEWLAKPGRLPTACITASVQLMNKTVGMFQHVPLPFCLSSFPLNRGTIYNDFVRNRERYNIESDDREKFVETS